MIWSMDFLEKPLRCLSHEWCLWKLLNELEFFNTIPHVVIKWQLISTFLGQSYFIIYCQTQSTKNKCGQFSNFLLYTFIIIMLSDRKSTPLVNDTLAGHTTEHVSELIPKVLITKN
jgi:hypothetical protein